MTALYHRDKLRTRHRDDLGIGPKLIKLRLKRTAFNARCGCDNAEALFACGGKLLSTRSQHADYAQLVFRKDILRVAGYCSAGGEDRLNAEALGKGDVLSGDGAYLCLGSSAVGHTARVPEVYYIFVRHYSAQLTYGGQTAEAGVEHAYRFIVHSNNTPNYSNCNIIC